MPQPATSAFASTVITKMPLQAQPWVITQSAALATIHAKPAVPRLPTALYATLLPIATSLLPTFVRAWLVTSKYWGSRIA